MARRIAVGKLQSRSIDIINTIRANASAEYQSQVPKVTTYKDIPKVGEVLLGYPALANQFLSPLLNQISKVMIESAVFNNPYSALKKGKLEYGELVEEVFVGLTKARLFDVEKTEEREFKRTIPDVRTAFHNMNYRVQYPITIQQTDLQTAFSSESGVTNFVEKIIQQVYTSAEYDEFLLFKYLIIKGVSKGWLKPIQINTSDWNETAVTFRATSNQAVFFSREYNEAGVLNTMPKTDQYIFMDAAFNAGFDVNVLASAFNMDKANFVGNLFLVDSFTTFDNERFDQIRKESDGFEEVTAAELALMSDVKAVLISREWFQIYDKVNKMTSTYAASGDYYNYFYNVWKIVSHSPFSPAISYVDSVPLVADSYTVEVTGKEIAETGTIFTLEVSTEQIVTSGKHMAIAPIFTQTEDATKKGIAVHKYGAYIFPMNATTTTPEFTIKGQKYVATTALTTAAEVGSTLTFSKR